MARAKREPRVPTREKSHQTRHALLDATELLLRSEGMDAVTTTRVAKKAGLSVGTVYEYFPSKDHLIAALEERSWTQVTERIMANAAELVRDKTARQASHAVIAFCVTVLRERIELHGFTRDNPETTTMRRANVERTAKYLIAFFGALGLVPAVPEPLFTFELAVVLVINATRLGTMYWPERLDDGSFQNEVATMVVTHFFGPETSQT